MFRNARNIVVNGGTFTVVEGAHCCNCMNIRPTPIESNALPQPSNVRTECSCSVEAQDDTSPNPHPSDNNSSSVCQRGQIISATHPPESTGASVSQPETSNGTGTTTERLEVGTVRIHATRGATIEVIPSSSTIQLTEEIFSNADLVVETSDSYIKIKLA